MPSDSCGHTWSDPNVPHYCDQMDVIKDPVVVKEKEITKSKTGKSAESDNVQVYIRIRPFISREEELNQTKQIKSIGTNEIEVQSSNSTLHCKYDAIFDDSFSQEQVYEKIKECTQAVLNGFNSTLFAYGQTGSGKSYTMFGSEQDPSKFNPNKVSAQAGIIPRAIRDIFKETSRNNVDIYCSFIQIYNENIYDLLRDWKMDKPLAIHEDRIHGIYVEGLSEYAVRSGPDCLSLLQCGEETRAVRATHMNQVSSRSHSVFQLLLERREADGTTIRSKLNLVDLAGSEKWNIDIHMKNAHISEMTNINKSLHVLGRCVAALSSTKQHVPYRDSKLTRLLQDSLGGNTKTRIIATLSPAADCIEESISTLKFADRAKQVMVFVRVNEDRKIDPEYVAQLEEKVQRLEGLLKTLGVEEGSEDAIEEGESEGNQQNRLQKLQGVVLRLSDENKQLRDQQKQNTVMNLEKLAISQQPESIDLSQLQEQNKQLEDLVVQFKQITNKFFAFEIEEDDLKTTIEKLCRKHKQTLPSAAKGSIPKPALFMNPKVKGHLTPGKPSLPSPSLKECLFRVRGKGGSGDSNQHWKTENKEKTEKDIQMELSQAKKAMRKQAKLQAWLMEKEQREMMKLQQEQEFVEQQRKLQLERDAKFYKRSKAVKMKLVSSHKKTRESQSEGSFSTRDEME